MKWLVYISFFVCLLRIGGGAVVTGVPSPEAPPIVKDEGALEKTSLDAECLAGSEWESNCHYCRCSDTGVAECLKQSSCVSDAVVEPIRCKPNTTFLKDCNTCVCLENGQGLCSITECLRLDPIALSSVPKKSDLKQGKDCAPGTRWTSQCNQCQCSSTGEGSCTKKACIGVENAPLLSCAPGSMWRNDCNTCRCTSDGIAMCTLMGCDRFTESESKDEFKTNPLLVRKTRAAQTEEPIKPTKGPPKNCQPGQEFRLDCNKCLCDNEGENYSCTRIDCAAINSSPLRAKRNTGTTRNVTMDCTPGAVFDRDCNVCRCTNDGHHAICTIKSCFSPNKVEEKTESDPGFRCEPGENFKRDCNDCTCAADGKSVFCTLHLCLSEVDA